MVPHKVASFANVIALLPLVADSHTSEVEKHTGQKLCHFGRYVKKAKLFCEKNFRPGWA